MPPKSQKFEVTVTQYSGKSDRMGLLRQNFVDELHGYRSFADRGRNPFYTSGADVPHREDPRQARFESIWLPDQRPTRRIQIRGQKIGSCLDELLVVECHAVAEPCCIGTRTRHRKQVADLAGIRRSRLLVTPGKAFEVPGYPPAPRSVCGS